MQWAALINWGIHMVFTLGQLYLAQKAQTDPRWAWIAPALGMAQSSVPSPLPTIKPPTLCIFYLLLFAIGYFVL